MNLSSSEEATQGPSNFIKTSSQKANFMHQDGDIISTGTLTMVDADYNYDDHSRLDQDPPKDSYGCLDHNKDETETSTTDSDTLFPEGGFGWLVVLASFIVTFTTFGVNLTFGVYQDYYLTVNAFQNATENSISWIGSIAAGALFLPGPLTQPLIRLLTLRIVVLTGIICCATGFILASYATSLWQLYLTQGLIFGWGGGMVFFSTISLPPQYFERKRGLATGLGFSGTGVGGLMMAPVTEWLIKKVGVHWCQRVVGFVILVSLLAILPFIRPRVTSGTAATTSGQGLAGLFELGLFEIRGFGWLFMVAFIVPFGNFTPVFLIPTFSSVVLGQTASTGANLVSLYCGLNAVARVLMGTVADRMGKTNTLFVSCTLASVSCLVLWSLSSKSIVVLTVFMAVYGMVGVGFISLFTTVTAQVVGVNSLPAALGILYFGQVPGNILGSPIATAVLCWQQGAYEGSILFSGLTLLLGALFVLMIRFQFDRKPLAFV